MAPEGVGVTPMGNTWTLSTDRRELVIYGPSGKKATLRSARPEGFTDADIAKAEDYVFGDTLEPNQVNTARLFYIGSKAFVGHLSVGPPTWWLPRLDVTRRHVMVGWLRGMVAVSWGGSP